MKKKLLLLSTLVLSVTSVQAQEFLVQNGSKLYDARLTIQCDADTCEGPATVKIFKKNTNQLIKTLKSQHMYTSFEGKKANINRLYDEQSGIFFDDFNFDGTQDIAIQNGSGGPYGSPQYDVYVFNQTKKDFVLSQALTSLASENLGMFEVDAKNKTLTTLNKDGAAWHQRQVYKVVPNKGLKMVREVTEDGSNGEKVTVTDRIFKNNHWVTTEKKYKFDDYYQ